MKKIKVALIHNIIAPYRIPLFNKLSKNKNIDLTVYFLNETASNRKWKSDLYKKKIDFNYKILPRFKITLPFSDPTDCNINFSIFAELQKKKFDVVIGAGWVDFACQIVPFLKHFFGYRYILWAGSTIDEPSLQRSISLPLVKSIIKRADLMISYGTKSKEYLVSLGGSPNKILSAFNAIDVNLFKNKSKSITLNKKNKFKKKYNINSKQKVVLYVGQFVKRKNIETLIKTMAKLNKKKLVLVLQGYGKLESSYVNLANKIGVNLKILPHAETDSLPLVYAMSDLFILPSEEEVWGLVVNEAMSCGLPIIVSNRAGCVPDLVREGENGFSFRHNNINDLKKKMNIILKNKKIMQSMKRKSLEIIEKKNIGSATKVFGKAINSVVS